MLASTPTARGAAAASCSSHEVRPCPRLNRVGGPGAQTTALRPVVCSQGAQSSLRTQRSSTSTRLNALVAVDPETAVATRPEVSQRAFHTISQIAITRCCGILGGCNGFSYQSANSRDSPCLVQHADRALALDNLLLSQHGDCGVPFAHIAILMTSQIQ